MLKNKPNEKLNIKNNILNNTKKYNDMYFYKIYCHISLTIPK